MDETKQFGKKLKVHYQVFTFDQQMFKDMVQKIMEN